MRKLFISILALAVVATPAVAQVRVKGYVKKDGTYVAPHYRSSPDSSRSNNWSSQGNVNPYTGKVGTQNPYGSPNYGSTNTYQSPYSKPAPSPWGSSNSGDDDE